MVNGAVLHYIYDPFCGWCYGAAPLVKAARQVLPIRAHGGGMMVGTQRQRVSPQLREYVLPHDRRIAQLSGQPFGDAYANGLLLDATAVFDSEPPIAAVLTAEEVVGCGLDLLASLQQAHYVEGRRIADESVLIEVAATLGIDEGEFTQTLRRVTASDVRMHIAVSRDLLRRVGAQGFTSFVLEVHAELILVGVSRFFGQPQAFTEWLREQAPSM